tara:strand:+ start:383 stop:532 length:150 start_codon:yes stop_codon:yes gene_type:complete
MEFASYLYHGPVEKTVPEKIYKKLPNRPEFDKRGTKIDSVKYGRNFTNF